VAAGQAHFVQHALVIGLAHEAVQGRKRAGGQQLQVAHGALGQLDRRQAAGLRLERVDLRGGHQQVHQLAAVRANKLVGL
jgi:hypothetical protein